MQARPSGVNQSLGALRWEESMRRGRRWRGGARPCAPSPSPAPSLHDSSRVVFGQPPPAHYTCPGLLQPSDGPTWERALTRLTTCLPSSSPTAGRLAATTLPPAPLVPRLLAAAYHERTCLSSEMAVGGWEWRLVCCVATHSSACTVGGAAPRCLLLLLWPAAVRSRRWRPG